MPTIRAFSACTGNREMGGRAFDRQHLSSEAIWNEKRNLFKEATHQHTADRAGIYIYELSTSGDAYTGVWALTPFEDIRNGRIKGYTPMPAEGGELMPCYRDNKCPDLRPALISYRAEPRIKELIDAVKLSAVPKIVRGTDGEHRLWAVTEPHLLDELIEAFGKLGTVVLACGNTQRIAMEMKPESRGNHRALFKTGAAPCFSSLYMAEDQLRSRPCHQLLTPGFPIDPESFFRIIRKDFDVLLSPGNCPVDPDRAHQFGLCLHGLWYQLNLKRHVLDGSSFTNRLDGNILYDHIILPARLLSGSVHGLSGAGGKDAMQKIMRLLDENRSLIAFTLYPASVNQIMSAGYTEATMPRGITWIEPEIPAGLLVHHFNTGTQL